MQLSLKGVSFPCLKGVSFPCVERFTFQCTVPGQNFKVSRTGVSVAYHVAKGNKVV